jgi:hypothetical protein
MVAIELVWVAIFLGLISATIFPYFRKRIAAANKGEPFKFDIVYLYNLVVATITTAGVNILFFIDYWPASDLPDPLTLFLAFVYGYAGFEGEKLAYKYYAALKERRTLKTGTAADRYAD